VGRPRRDITGSYLNKLAAAGIVQRRGGILVPKWLVLNQARAAAARVRLDAVAFGGRHDAAQASLAALVSVTGLSRNLYPGRQNANIWKQLGQVAQGHWIAAAVRQAIKEAEDQDSYWSEQQRRRRRNS
jgi:hypothetical protein